MGPNSIHKFRTHQFRVIRAEAYFKLDLEEEIEWHEKHLKNLRLQVKNPDLFHKARTAHKIEEHHHRHFQEHVLDSIPFHEKILNDHKLRLKTVLDMMPEKNYKKLHKLAVKHDAHPDYLVFDKVNKDFFFVVDRPTPEKEKWSKIVKKKKLAEVMFLD